MSGCQAYNLSLIHILDAILIETIFDTLNAKAAIFAAEQAMKVTGVEVPVMLSVTVSEDVYKRQINYSFQNVGCD